jgi:hypothetical protein
MSYTNKWQLPIEDVEVKLNLDAIFVKGLFFSSDE